jgi:hypothetical protein
MSSGPVPDPARPTSRFNAMRTLALALLIVLSACDGLPRDAAGTLERVRRGGALRVGAAGEAKAHIERAEAFAETLGARMAVEHEDAHALVRRLSEGELDLVVGLPKDTPFAHELGLSQPAGEPLRPDGPPTVWAVRAGENGLLMAVDRFLAVP